jgi:HAD superfamily hydrolase (TIGR01484 family)
MNKKVFAFDLDGTLTEHRTWITDENLAVLQELKDRGFRVVLAGAGQATRIFRQLREFPVDIIGNYGMQYSVYRDGALEVVRDIVLPCDQESVAQRAAVLREKYGFTEFRGKNVEYHSSGCVTFPILGTEAFAEDKLAFDPDRKKRRSIYDDVKKVFSDYTVFVGGSSSFDMAPFPFDKAYALAKYCEERGIAHDEVVYIGDDYGSGGNDESVYKSDFNYLTIDNYEDFPSVVKELL